MNRRTPAMMGPAYAELVEEAGRDSPGRAVTGPRPLDDPGGDETEEETDKRQDPANELTANFVLHMEAVEAGCFVVDGIDGYELSGAGLYCWRL